MQGNRNRMPEPPELSLTRRNEKGVFSYRTRIRRTTFARRRPFVYVFPRRIGARPRAPGTGRRELAPLPGPVNQISAMGPPR
ncbi:hypothetical protein EVAR_39253_1 [Eumeta japonica]|uniref:Uncharacterized protein n=1 Tax=Eumeta variegata TaxID=151549 RepID=A0A4C1Y2M4_EUMVA|nr:hypothetical protein EVAR_39253_1 [Eumeta japonica]